MLLVLSYVLLGMLAALWSAFANNMVLMFGTRLAPLNVDSHRVGGSRLWLAVQLAPRGGLGRQRLGDRWSLGFFCESFAVLALASVFGWRRGTVFVFALKGGVKG